MKFLKKLLCLVALFSCSYAYLLSCDICHNEIVDARKKPILKNLSLSKLQTEIAEYMCTRELSLNYEESEEFSFEGVSKDRIEIEVILCNYIQKLQAQGIVVGDEFSNDVQRHTYIRKALNYVFTHSLNTIPMSWYKKISYSRIILIFINFLIFLQLMRQYHFMYKVVTRGIGAVACILEIGEPFFIGMGNGFRAARQANGAAPQQPDIFNPLNVPQNFQRAMDAVNEGMIAPAD